MKNAINAVMAVVVLAGAASAAELNATNFGSVREAAVAVALPQVQAAPAALVWKGTATKHLTEIKGEGLPDIVIKAKGADIDVVFGGKKMTLAEDFDAFVFEHDGDTIRIIEGKKVIFNGKSFSMTSSRNSRSIVAKFNGMTMTVTFKDNRTVLSGNLSPENIKIAACEEAFYWYTAMLLSSFS